MLTNLQLADFVVKAYNAKWVYWYGTYGKKCTKSLYESKKKQYPSHYTSSRTAKYMSQIEEGRWCADCIGLGKAFVWSNGVFEGDAKYATNGMPDKSADGMYEYAKSKGLANGPISTLPETPGIAVRMSGHVGYYIGNGYVIEERGFDYGCVKTKLKDRKWLNWYELPGVTYVKTPAPEPIPEPVETNEVVKVTKGNYYVRTEPNKNSKDIGVAHKGESYPYLGVTSGSWYSINYNGKNAWVSSKCGEVVTAPPSKVYFKVKNSKWNVRKGPSILYKSYGVVRAGESLEYLGEEKNGWYYVKSAKYTGWISGKGIVK